MGVLGAQLYCKIKSAIGISKICNSFASLLFALYLPTNYGVDHYDIGTWFRHFAIATLDVSSICLCEGSI